MSLLPALLMIQLTYVNTSFINHCLNKRNLLLLNSNLGKYFPLQIEEIAGGFGLQICRHPNRRKGVEETKKIVIEVMFKADYCLPCFYMDETVRETIPQYDRYVEYRRVDFMKEPGKGRFLELSCSLFGEDGVYKHCRVAPVPSMFINGELVFDAIPPRFELEEAIEEAIQACYPSTREEPS